jgi:hypothetical protein
VSTIEYGRKRVAAFLEEIDRLRQSEFPYGHPCDALDLLAERFRNHQSILEKATLATPDVVNNACSASLYELQIYLPILGFILRSTDVRNAFEVYAPLLRLARTILGNDTKLILSSEWELSPFVYRSITGLGGFVLIGLPSPESANPLLIPLAGHELGHSVWQTEDLSKKFEERIKNGILSELLNNRWGEFHSLYPHYKKEDLGGGDLFAPLVWKPAYTWTLLQTEEIFCDFFGLQLFAESYLHAFAYLISPGICGQRSPAYPNITRRVSHLVRAAKAMSVSVPDEFTSSFIGETEPPEPVTKLLASVADTVSASFELDLIDLTRNLVTNKGAPTRKTEIVSTICDEFLKRIAPPSKPQSLTDITNAGWDCILNPDLWRTFPQIRLDDRARVLSDLMLKTMEVSEIYEKLERRP